ncbi:MAG: Lrp/AsnC family transcriptional regulator [Candidatus Nitrosotenuis sp.]|nr:Lrp/AsnC family transcriptional regulator [Nitrososphaerota archaeon]TBR24695.1 MAG: Lrp/AsnC family transcriptional regulator [Candidatus Nitrosotenuis sp.]
MLLDKTDIKILKNLLVDARLSSRQMALKLGMSTVTILTRIKKMEKEKIVKGYTAIIDHEKLGYDLTAIIEIFTKKGKMVEIENELSSLENVCAVYDVTGESDTVVVAKFKNREELSKFVKTISSKPNVDKTVTNIVLSTVKEDFRLV